MTLKVLWVIPPGLVQQQQHKFTYAHTKKVKDATYELYQHEGLGHWIIMTKVPKQELTFLAVSLALAI